MVNLKIGAKIRDIYDSDLVLYPNFRILMGLLLSVNAFEWHQIRSIDTWCSVSGAFEFKNFTQTLNYIEKTKKFARQDTQQKTTHVCYCINIIDRARICCWEQRERESDDGDWRKRWRDDDFTKSSSSFCGRERTTETETGHQIHGLGELQVLRRGTTRRSVP